MKVLIIEDEIKAARELKTLLEAQPEPVTVLALLPSVKAAVNWLRDNEMPDLIFSDIQLADGLCFDIYKTLPVHAPIIFCTAFDEYAIRAFEANGIDYLLKPVEESRLQQSLGKYKTFRGLFSGKKEDYETRLGQLFARLDHPYQNTLLIHFQGRIIPLKTSRIACVHSHHDMVSVYTLDHQKYSVSTTLDELETTLDPGIFFRANRQFLLNRSAILEAEHYFSRRLLVRLVVKTPESVIVSKVKAPDFLRWMETT